jgi:hypothetical protein
VAVAPREIESRFVERNDDIHRETPVLLPEERCAFGLGLEKSAALAAHPFPQEIDRPVGVPDQGGPERLVKPERVGKDRVRMREHEHAPAARSAALLGGESPGGSEKEKGGNGGCRHPLEQHRLRAFQQGV